MVGLALLGGITKKKTFCGLLFHGVQDLPLVGHQGEVIDRLEVVHEAIEHRLHELLRVATAE